MCTLPKAALYFVSGLFVLAGVLVSIVTGVTWVAFVATGFVLGVAIDHSCSRCEAYVVQGIADDADGDVTRRQLFLDVPYRSPQRLEQRVQVVRVPAPTPAPAPARPPTRLPVNHAGIAPHASSFQRRIENQSSSTEAAAEAEVEVEDTRMVI